VLMSLMHCSACARQSSMDNEALDVKLISYILVHLYFAIIAEEL
jgi:hypothetical protein